MIKENLEKIKNKIKIAEKKANRAENSVKLMAVSKFHPISQIIESVEHGQFLFGENRVQEAVQKFTDPVFSEYKMEQITIRVKLKKKISCIEFIVNSEKQITTMLENLNDENLFITIGPMTINKDEIRWIEVVK